MKQLIIGIDGGDEQLIRKLPMPFLNGLLDSAHTQKLTEDLLSRGWVQILCGEHARETKAFYMVSQCDGTPEIKFKYSLTELLSNEEVTPIWKLPPEGSSVGMMNVPTTFPAPEVNGFFVSGAGGGVNKVDGIPEALCHPKSLARDLEELGYVIDLRFGTAGIKEINVLFDRLCELLERRADAFEKLVSQYSSDFGFVTFRAPTVVQYLAMSEMELYFERALGKSNATHAATETWKTGFERLYGVLDQCIKRAFEAAGAEQWIITSDHGAVPYKYRLNIHRFLQDHGYQPFQTDYKDTLKSAAKRVVRGTPFAVSRKADLSTATAFGKWYLTGIFVNDKERFGGPVDPSEIGHYVEKLCRDFNATSEAKKYNMEAKPYRSLTPEAKYEAHLPDVKIHCSDEVFFSRFEGPFVRENPDYGPLPTIDKVAGGMHTGQKGRHPLFCCDNTTASLIKSDDPKDLRLVYKLTQRIFS